MDPGRVQKSLLGRGGELVEGVSPDGKSRGNGSPAVVKVQSSAYRHKRSRRHSFCLWEEGRDEDRPTGRETVRKESPVLDYSTDDGRTRSVK